MDRFDVVAQLVERIEQNEDFDDILIEADERNLPDETVELLCKEVADNLEGEHLIGYLFLLLEHVLAHARSAMDAESTVFEIRRLLLSENAHARDEAADHLRQSALMELRRYAESKGGDE